MRSHEERLQALMLAGLAGDTNAYHQLLNAATPLLRAYYRRRLNGAEQDVEDLVQETLIAIHGRRETHDSSRPFTAWMFALARYKLVDLFRRPPWPAPCWDRGCCAGSEVTDDRVTK